LWSTTDGGRHYTELGEVLGPLHHAGDNGDIEFVDGTHGFVWTSTLVASGWTVRRTSDGGRTWHRASSSEERRSPFGPPAKFEFATATEGYASGFTTAARDTSADLFRTVDAGTSWQRIGPVIAGQHAAGLPTLLGDRVFVPILRLDRSASSVELYEGMRDDAESPWRLVWAVHVPVRAPATWPGIPQPVVALTDSRDALVAVWQDAFVGVEQSQPVARARPSDLLRSLSATGPLVFAAADDGVFVTSDNGASWRKISLPTP
jgi:photosystem II stability/assembly factor-like uncharacterized protein